MRKTNFLGFLALITLACNSPLSKRVLIMGRGQLTVNDNEVTVKDGSGYVEKTVELKGDKAVSWTVSTPSGKTTINIPEEKGFYILNLKTDTIVGSEQNLGKDLGGGKMSQEELKAKIDSLHQLLSGSNVSLGGRNYFILPNQLIKISANTEAKIFGPFTKIPGTLEVDKNSGAPEIYKFYTTGEMRELIANLKKLTF